MEESSIANNGGLIKYNSSRDNNNFALIAILVTLIAILVTIYCCTQVYPYDLDPGNFCHSKNQSTQHLTDTRSTQVYPSDLDQWNYCHPKNRSTQTDKLQQRDHGVQTVSYSQSSSASQTPCYLDINSRLRPFSDKTTTAKRLTKLKPDYDGPIMHGPFSCDCPGDSCIFRS